MSENNEQWATVDLMGHVQTAGRILMEGGLLRVDVPDGESYRTEYYGMTAIYSIKIVSEEIARAYVRRTPDIVAYDQPIVTREQHQSVVRHLEQNAYELQHQVNELTRRLTTINSLPAPAPDETDMGHRCNDCGTPLTATEADDHGGLCSQCFEEL